MSSGPQATTASRRTRPNPGADRVVSGRPATDFSWRVIDDGPLDGALNMALDDALAREVAEGRAVLRLYGWSRPTVSFGRNEPACAEYSRVRLEEMAFGCVRRPTGGRAVLHAEEVTYSVIMPIRAVGGVRAAYHRINVALASALAAMGASVEMSQNDRSAPLEAGPCFGIPARGEVVAAGRKIVGSAQARVGSALLQHGSVLVSGGQDRLEELREGSHDRAGESVATSLSALVGSVDETRLRAEVARAMQREFGGSWDRGEYSTTERDRAESLITSRYGDPAWTWRR